MIWKKIHTLVTEKENQKLDKMAEELKMDKAALIRYLIFDKAFKEGEDD